ncbi:MAG: methyltransferase domain-containing protein [Magnetococcales bacterium]|nr:methyltransferase domain-containing protein [Magnetococcales bacterium]NGZ05113.1 methyltransferase domain-containing protein [Magnetococcales bacterium]
MNDSIATNTGRLYASIWDRFSKEEWERFSNDHFHRWSPLPLPSGFLKDQICLDAGCGSGRAVRSMLLEGAAKVYAIDMGEGCIRNTTERNAEYADRLDARLASVLNIPFEDNTFDFVHCDGVLHHTTDPQGGFRELHRVLKPGGKMVMAVYGKGGLMNLAIYTSRLFRHLIPEAVTWKLCHLISNNPVTWYAIMDCMYVPIRANYRDHEIRAWFDALGYRDVIRLDSTWGAYGMGRWMNGEGYLKFLAEKPKT